MQEERQQSEELIFVTRPSLPELSELLPLLEQIWNSSVVTNCGPFHNELEEMLARLVGSACSLMTNGAAALSAAIWALNVQGEVITTPYSFAATSHSIMLAGLRPVFVDVDPSSGNLDPSAVADAVTHKTQAILAVHCYGYPADVEALSRIARQRGLALLYDAAHAFGAEFRGAPLPSFGDASATSFHATKLFSTLEGGAAFTQSTEVRRRLNLYRNFGIAAEGQVPEVGTNFKMDEVRAAIGLLQLRNLELEMARRARVAQRYDEMLEANPFVQQLRPKLEDFRPNYAYYPVLITDESRISRDQVLGELRKRGVIARRYFFPLLTDTPPYVNKRRSRFPNASRLARSVITLPIYGSLTEEQVERVVSALNEALLR